MKTPSAVHLVHFYSAPGGIEAICSRILPSFSGNTFRVFVVRPPAEETINVYEGSDVQVTYGSRSNPVALFILWKYARRNRNDIFHLFNLGPFFLLAARIAGARRIVYSIHGTRYWKNFRQRAIRKNAWRLALGRNVIVTSNSEYSRRVFIDNVCRSHPVKVVYNPIGSNRFVPAPSPVMSNRPGELKIIYAGRLEHGKNLDKWIDIALYLHGRNERLIFEIYGTGPLGITLGERIKKAGAENFITLKGYRSDIENVFRDADLLLFLSEYESFGNVVVECILCGTPVIASDIPSMREIFSDYPVFLVDPDSDPGSRIAVLLQNYEALSDAATSAGKSFRERFSDHSYIESMNNIYSTWNG